jgi:hypothetical protein
MKYDKVTTEEAEMQKAHRWVIFVDFRQMTWEIGKEDNIPYREKWL